MTTTSTCDPSELRTLFLFEKLNDEQLDWLCREGQVETFEAGPIYIEGDPATCFYVLLEGAVVMSRRVGSDDIEVNRTSDKGVYAGHVAIGTWIAGTPGAPEGAPLKEPDDIARLYWDLHTRREPAEHLISA